MTNTGPGPETPGALGLWVRSHKRLTAAAVILALWAMGSTSSADEPENASADSSASSSATVEPSEESDSSNEAAVAGDDAVAEPASDDKEAKPRPRGKPDPKPRPEPAPRTYLVTRIIDGDTLELGTGDDVRIVGIDTPEVGECGYDKAAANLSYLTLGKQVTLTVSDEDRDRYGRLLRYVNVGQLDAGLRLIQNGLAIARYDSRDGYGFHPREPQYIAADKASPNLKCAAPQPVAAAPEQGSACAPGYTPCIPPFPPDLNCDDVDGPITVTGNDPHGLDGDGDGIACE